MKEQDLEKILSNIEVEPTEAWVSSTSKLLKAELNEKKNNSNFIYLFSNFMNKNVLMFFSIFMVTIMFAGGFFFYNSQIGENKDQKVNNIVLSSSEKQNILKQIAKNNAARATTDTAAPMAESSAMSSSMMIPIGSYFESDPGYFYSVVSTTVPGNANKKCQSYSNMFNSLTSISKSGSYTYYAENGDVYNSYDSYNLDGQLLSYSFYQYQIVGDSRDIQYYGGKYAIENMYQYDNQAISTEPGYAESMPAEEPLPPVLVENEELTFDQYFGEGADIVGTIKENGRTLYLVQYEYDMDCTDSYNTNLENEKPDFWNGEDYTYDTIEYTPTNKIIQVDYIDSETFEYVKNETYLDTFDNANLIFRSTNKQTKEKLDLSIIEAKMTDPIKGVETRTNYVDDGSSFETTDERATRELSDMLRNNLDFLNVSGQNLSLSYSYVTNSSVELFDSIYSDRDLFPAGELGDQMYKDYGYSNTMPAVYLSTQQMAMYFTNENADFSVDVYVYDKNLSDVEILNENIYSPVTEKSSKPIDVTVDGNVIKGTLYEYFNNYEYYVDTVVNRVDPESVEMMAEPGVTMPGEPSCDNCESSSHLIIFQLGDYKYALRMTDNTKQFYETAKFNISKFAGLSLNLLDSQDNRAQIYELLLEKENRNDQIMILDSEPKDAIYLEEMY